MGLRQECLARSRAAKEAVHRLRAAKEAVRRPSVWPGLYPVYVVLADGGMLCTRCARKNWRSLVWSTLNEVRDGWAVAGAEVLWETESGEWCAHCNRFLESAYGPTEAELREVSHAE